MVVKAKNAVTYISMLANTIWGLSYYHLSISWSPGYTKIRENEKADKLVKETAKLQSQFNTTTTYYNYFSKPLSMWIYAYQIEMEMEKSTSKQMIWPYKLYSSIFSTYPSL